MDLRDRQLSEVDSPAAWQRVGFAVAVGTIGSVGMWSMPVALPFVQTNFGITRADASLPYTLAMMGFAFGGVAMGRLCDSFGVVVAIMLGSLALGVGVVGASRRTVPMYAIIVRQYFSPKEVGIRNTGSYQAAFLNGLIWNVVNAVIVLWLMVKDYARHPAAECHAE
jgi:hypothetical protein